MAGKRKRKAKWIAGNRTVSVIANCRDCDWDCQYQANARELGRRHSQKNGHYVSVEITRALTYDYRLKAARKGRK